MLKGLKPQVVKASKPHIMISGKAGTGKTIFALNFPAPYFIDTEGGASREQYTKKLQDQGGAYLGISEGAQDFREVIAQVRELATTKHPYRTLVVDSFSKLYNVERTLAEERVGSDFGVDKREANRPTKQLIMWLKRLDMSVVLICHQRDKWERREKQLLMAGSTFDGFDKMEYELDLWLETKMLGNTRYATIVKSRIDAFPMNTDIDLDYATFKKLYGAAVIDETPVQIVLATKEQLEEIKNFLENLKVEPEELTKWLAKAQATEIDDLSKENATLFLEFLTKKIKGAKK